MNRISILLATTMLTAGFVAAPSFAQSAGGPVETRPPNAAEQVPAFAGQTRAPQPDAMPTISHEVIADGLPQLWSMELMSDGRMLVTAKQGALHIIDAEGKAGPAISGLPEVDARGQGGLLDVALAKDFDTSGRIFFSFSEPRDGVNGTSVASAKLVQDDAGGGALEDVKVIFQQTPGYEGDKHYGSRLVVNDDDTLYVTVGERSDPETRVQAQDVSTGFGKVFRIDLDGKAPADNPLVGDAGAQPEIWSYGHRNMQGATLDAEGRLWTLEHGPKGGDELNRPQAGLNYGWPVITYGEDYSGAPIGDGITQKEGLEQPVYYWDPVIGPSGMAFYDGDAIAEWKNSILIGGLVSQGLVVLHMDGDKVAFEERVPLEARVRDVKVGPDGSIYAVTENSGTSQILRISKS